jgi:hypothetical protein
MSARRAAATATRLTSLVVAGPGPEQPDRARDIGQVVGKHVLAQQRLGDTGSEQLGDLLEFRTGAAGTRASQDRHLLPGIEKLGRPGARLLLWLLVGELAALPPP